MYSPTPEGSSVFSIALQLSKGLNKENILLPAPTPQDRGNKTKRDNKQQRRRSSKCLGCLQFRQSRTSGSCLTFVCRRKHGADFTIMKLLQSCDNQKQIFLEEIVALRVFGQLCYRDGHITSKRSLKNYENSLGGKYFLKQKKPPTATASSPVVLLLWV